jgi:thiosulfate/3-mercaptopyruvate sulfurtransferase
MESPIIQPTELLELNPEEFILFDASAGSKTRYEESHLNGAFFIDVNTELANIADFSVGGRHPLPTLEQFATVLQKFGVTKNSHIIVYDDKNAANAAARFWWMLKAIGHQKVQVLNGGFNAAIEAGFTTNAALPFANKAGHYNITNWNLPLADINEVEEASKTGSQTIVDVRDANRYAGLTEPIDLIAGHIPNAINIPFTENLDENGFFLAPEILKQKYQAAFDKVTTENIIVHCGSGITACHTLLAMNYANLQIPKLYVGSWSEWSRNEKEMVLAPKS